MLDAIRRDLRQSLRALERRTTSTIATVVTIALVVGAGTAVYAVINATLVRPLPYPDAGRLVVLYTMPPGTTSRADRNPLNPLDFVRFRERLRQADAIEGAWRRERALGGDQEPTSVEAAQVSAGFLALLGGTPVHGRFWSADEDRARASVVVLSYGLWQRVFGADPSIVGRRVTLDRESFEVIGVANEGFRPSFIPSQLWTPLGIQESYLPSPRATYLQTIARLAPGATPATLAAEVAATMADISREAADTRGGWRAELGPLRDQEFGNQAPALAVLAAAVALLLIIAVVNLANLRLARGIAERPERALRVALGASRWDLIRLQIVEGVLLGAVGGAIGTACAVVAVPLLLALDPQTARAIGDVPIDWRVIASAAALAMSVSLVSGLVPLLRRSARRATVAAGIRVTASRGDLRVRRLLIGVESALAMALLISSAVVISAAGRIASRDLGFDPEAVVAGQLRLPEASYPTPEARAAFVDRVLARVRALPGVASASTTLNPFIPGSTIVTLVEIDGRPAPTGLPHTVQFRRVSDRYFETMQTAVIAGRAIDARDRIGTELVTVVSATFASRFWPGEDPIGRRVRRSNAMLTVVGVAADVFDLGPGTPAAPILYVPYAQNNAAVSPATLVVRVTGDPAAFAPQIRRSVLEVDPLQPIERLTTVDRYLSETLGRDRFRGSLLALLAALGLLFTALGIYGVTSCLVEERTRELGVRMVLGATAASVWRLVTAQAGRVVAVGAAIGAIAAVAAARLLEHVVSGVEAGDGWSAAPAIVVLALVTLVAAGVPALRAARGDLAVVLKS